MAVSVPAEDGAPSCIRLFPHQREGAERLRQVIADFGGALLADEPGMGKTFTALDVARDYARVVVVSPAVLRSMWRDAARQSGVAIEWMSYERLSARGDVAGRRADLLILDEAHHARNPTTRRYRAIAALAWGARVLLLSATPVHNARGDLAAIFALFLGSASEPLGDAVMARLVVRRRIDEVASTLPQALPTLRALRWEAIPPAPELARDIVAIPPPLPAADGGRADALVRLSLLRAWCSSDAALLDAIARRLAAGAALEHALSEGRHPTRRELEAWRGDTDCVQLGFATLLASAGGSDTSLQLADLGAHMVALRALRGRVCATAGAPPPAEARDPYRLARLRATIDARGVHAAVVFTHSRATALAAYRALLGSHRVALLTGERGIIASGTIPRDELLVAFARAREPAHPHRGDANGRTSARDADPQDLLRIDALIATDVVSEGINLPEAGLVVHLDLPWTPARLEQRVGRARRIGARADEIRQVAIAPPLDADELRFIVRRLAEKGGIARRIIGDALPPGAALVPADRAGEEVDDGWSATDVASRLRAACERIARCLAIAVREAGDRDLPSPRANVPWLASAAGAIDPPAVIALIERRRCMPHAPTDGKSAGNRGAFSSAVFEAVVIDLPAAVVRESSLRPASLLRALHAFAPLGAHPVLVRAPAARSAGARAIEAASAWCAARDAEEATLAGLAQRSRAHTAMLRRIRRAEERARRVERAAVLAASVAARDVVLRTSGVGGERILDVLLAEGRECRASDRSDLPWLRRVQVVLAERARAPATSVSSRRLVALASGLPNE